MRNKITLIKQHLQHSLHDNLNCYQAKDVAHLTGSADEKLNLVSDDYDPKIVA
ncbi:hypothetical protein CASFOL_031390 [Castilleja foliolosa]|uniref:Uncharacterized protein n=1 Tax=Castilleja foliolosa TaxID=1961234 RepID=A0ABD3C7H2_9LAMI